MKNFKYYFYLLIIIVIASACESVDSVKSDIHSLQMERDALRIELNAIEVSIHDARRLVVHMDDQVEALDIQKSGHEPKYILTLHLRQISYSLSISKQIRDAANTVDFQIPVDADYYNAVNIGQEIVDDFRVGSLIMRGSFGNWRITVKNKSIQ